MNQILEITDQLLVTDDGFLEKPDQGLRIKDQGRRDQFKIYHINYPPRHDSEHCAYVPVFAYWLAIIRDSYARAKINLGWFRWRIPLQTCQSRLFLCESQEFIRWLMHKITFAKIYQGNISKWASLFYTKRLWFPSPILGQTCLLAHRRWGVDVSRNVPQRRWERRNVCFRRLIPGKTDWSYLPLLADRMCEVFSRREASWKWSSVQGLQNNGLLAFNKFKADVLSPIFSFFTGKLISLVRVMVKITRTLYVTYSTCVQTQDRWKSPVTRKTAVAASEFLPQIPYQLQSVSILH